MIIWSEESLFDLQAIYDFIFSKSPKNAEMLVNKIAEIVDSLEFMPYKFPKEPYINDESIRFIPKFSFKIIYKIQKEDIIVLNIFSTHQNPENLFLT